MAATLKKTKLFEKNIDGQLVTVEQIGNLRTLHFNNSMLQSQIDIVDANHLPLTGNRLMLASLMFGNIPEKILLAGCGGGAIARWFNAVLPASKGIAVESSPQVTDLAREYFQFPATDSNWQLKHDHIQNHLADSKQRYDYILFDIEEHASTPPWMLKPAFLQRCKQLVSDKGCITFNLVARNAADFAKAIVPIRQTFVNRTCCLSSPSSQNIIVLAFTYRPDISKLQLNAAQASNLFGIEFKQFYEQLLKDNPPGSGIF